jgi:hypothetical protein
MSNSYANYINLRLPETSKSDDTSDEANRRREMRRKQHNATIKIQNHDRIASKNLLDEVLGKEFVQSKTKTLANQPDIGRHQGLPVPAQLTSREDKNEMVDQKKLADFDAQLSLEKTREFLDNRELSTTDRNENFNKFNENLKENEALAISRQDSEFDETNTEKEQQSSLSTKKFPQSPLSMVTSQLDKLKNQILLIDQNRLQDGIDVQDLKELAEQQASMATSLEFLEGYADGVVKDEVGRQKFEQSCNDLREQLIQSEHNFNLALGNIDKTEPKQLLVQSQSQSQSQRIAGLNDRMTTTNKRELEERTRLLKDSSEVQTQDGKQKSSRLEDTNSTQRVRAAKRDRDNSELTLPLLVQRSV